MIYKDVADWSRVEIVKFSKGFLYENSFEDSFVKNTVHNYFAVNSQIHLCEIPVWQFIFYSVFQLKNKPICYNYIKDYKFLIFDINNKLLVCDQLLFQSLSTLID